MPVTRKTTRKTTPRKPVRKPAKKTTTRKPAKKTTRKPARKTGGNATDVQSVTFDKRYWDVPRAVSWLRERGFKSSKVDTTLNQLRFRQRDPSKYDRYTTKVVSPTINLVIGFRSVKRTSKKK